MKIQVKNLTSPNGNKVPNQFEININYAYYFQSYETIIAIIDERKSFQNSITLDTNALNYSRTTSKYLYKWLRMNRKEIENKIKTKEIILKDLN
tara:strand:+ start:210 stop:491 length:282 start_codon:yes stop_codon:yes gene_type:complete